MVPFSFDQAAWWALMDAQPLPVAFIGADRRYHFVNRAWETWAMRRRTDIVGRTLEEVLGRAAASAVETYVQTALAGATIHFESSIPYQRLGTRRVKVSMAGMLDGKGAPVGFFAFVEDVTSEHDAETAIAAALDGIGDGYLAVNNSYAFTYVNSGAARFYGLSREAMVGRKIEDLFPGSLNSPSGRMLVEVMETRIPQRREMPSAGAPGRSFLMDIVPTTTGGVGVVIQDTTDQAPRAPRGEPLPEGLITIAKPSGEADG